MEPTIEILRTMFPSIPMFIAIPSFALLYNGRGSSISTHYYQSYWTSMVSDLRVFSL
ncbi:hypothetical protein JHK86_034360 [Glycine max]|nr:hypothetical protein JHK86_034360 [Glycine max]